MKPEKVFGDLESGLDVGVISGVTTGDNERRSTELNSA